MVFTKIEDTWDDYLASGEALEKEFLALLQGLYPKSFKIEGNYKYADIKIPEIKKMVEVKRDLKSDETQNFAFEFEFKGEASGLTSTKADLWVMADSQKFYIFSTERLKDFFRENWEHVKKVKGGDSGDAKMILVRKFQISNQSFCASFKRGDLFSVQRLKGAINFLLGVEEA